MNDDDNEVRERSFMYCKALKSIKDEKKEQDEIVNFVFPKKVNSQNPIDELNIDIIQKVLNVEKENLLKSEDISK